MLNARQWFLNLVPPPRKRVTVGAILPLILFLLAFGGGCLWLSLTRLVVFSSVAPFWLLILGVWLWWFQMAGFSGLKGFRSAIALFVRLCVLGCFILALAEPRVVRKNNGQAVV